MWPDNAAAVSVFVSMSTQWRVGPGGAYGLDYNVMPYIIGIRDIPAADAAEVFDAVRVMESAALDQIRQNKG